MPNYKCERCLKEFDQKCNYTHHINKKFPCKEITPKYSKITPDCSDEEESETMCHYCGKEFTRKFNLIRHIAKNCKVKKENDVKMEEMMTMLIEIKENNKKTDMLHNKEIAKLKEEVSKCKQIINNTQNNIKTQNNTININISPYGKEDISHLSYKDYKKIFSRGAMCVPAFVEKVHFDKNKPENHNVYISNMRTDYATLYDGKQWMIQNKDVLLDDIYDKKAGILLDQYEQQSDSLDESTKKMFDRFGKRYEEEDEKLKTFVKKETQQTLYNNRETAMKTRKENLLTEN